MECRLTFGTNGFVFFLRENCVLPFANPALNAKKIDLGALRFLRFPREAKTIFGQKIAKERQALPAGLKINRKKEVKFMETIEARIKQLQKGNVTKAYKKLINYLEEVDYQDIIYLSITEFAEKVGLAEATVLRFCRALGFNGYHEFKINLAQHDKKNDFGKADGLEYISDIMLDYQNAMLNCRKSLSVDLIDAATDLIFNARNICCFGAGNSYIVALELHNRLMKMGIYTQCERDSHMQSILCSTCGEKDLLIVFSVSGQTKDTLDVVSLAKYCGMKVIAVTCHGKSPLTRYADLVFSTGSMESPAEPGSLTSRIMHLFIVNVLCVAIRQKDPERFTQALSTTTFATASKLL